jgi:hypothetical protein
MGQVPLQRATVKAARDISGQDRRPGQKKKAKSAARRPTTTTAPIKSPSDYCPRNAALRAAHATRGPSTELPNTHAPRTVQCEIMTHPLLVPIARQPRAASSAETPPESPERRAAN